MRVPRSFQGLKFLDLEIPQNSRQGQGLYFQGFFQLQGETNNPALRIFQSLSMQSRRKL